MFLGDCWCAVGKQIIDKSFGFDTAVEEAQRAINAAHVESESAQNGIGLVKLMGRYSGM
jgi:6-phosphofructokinase 1